MMGGGILLGKYYKRAKIIRDPTFCIDLTSKEFYNICLKYSDYKKNLVSSSIKSTRAWPDKTLIGPIILAFWSDEE